MAELKESIKEYDFTSISTRELAMVSFLLHENGLINDSASLIFSTGNGAYDERGHQTGKDVKFNAIAMFNQMLEETLAAGTPGFKEYTKGLIQVNQVLGALSYFVNSAQSDLFVSIEV
ncbi:hypothetical protein [Pseudomonas sp. P1.8]|uniref:hypothetical protein n=1 Tax=Pseudomonas sp. P1.8 TaxID=1699310 RepID=UPI00069D1773|nr:hypothetical protein [Pseudomonas sp. P1.8]